MSDFARLEEKLAKLKSQEIGSRAGRTLKVGDDVLAAILTEMGETILPRRLSFSGGGKTVHLAVANRRCQALLSPVAGDYAAASQIADKAIPDAEDESVPVLRDYLRSIFGGASDIIVQSARLKAPYASDIGVPIPQLARAWEVSAGSNEDRPPEDVMKDFLAGLDGLATGWLNIVGEDVVAHGGPEDRREALGEHAALFLDGYFAKFDTLYGEESGAVLTAFAARDAALVFAELGEQSAFVEAPTTAVAQIAALWGRLTA